MGKLYVVPTPVGNMEDMTFRAIRILKEADLILAEDTRTSGILLKHYEIKNAMQSHHKFNEHQTVESIVNRIKGGQTVALISDAGTPGISDPGFLVVRECVRNGIEVQCLPGATAFVPALVSSGLPDERFCFEGFLPQKKGRMTRLNALKEERPLQTVATIGDRRTHDDFLRIALPSAKNANPVCGNFWSRPPGFRMSGNFQDT